MWNILSLFTDKINCSFEQEYFLLIQFNKSIGVSDFILRLKLECERHKLAKECKFFIYPVNPRYMKFFYTFVFSTYLRSNAAEK